MYLATKTLQGSFPLLKKKPTDGIDKATICREMKEMKQAEMTDVSILLGEHIKKGVLAPCIEKDLVERGVLVEASELPESTETMADVKGSKTIEQATEVSIGHKDGVNKGTSADTVAPAA